MHKLFFCNGHPRIRSVFCALFVVSFVCFIPDLYNGLLIWDDVTSILNNTHIHTFSLEMLRWAFFDFYIVTWFPLTWISLALDYAVWGTNPVGYHLTNNILHALNSGLTFLLFFELLKNRLIANASTNDVRPVILRSSHYFYCSIVAALFFSLHPLRVESVAWASERKDVLSLFFGLLAVLAYLRHTQAERALPSTHQTVFFSSSVQYWQAFTLFCLSLLSKPMMVTLPFVLLLLDWYPLARFKAVPIKNLLIEKAPWLICSVIVSVITTLSQKPLILSHAQTSIFARTLNAFKSLCMYVWFTVWPVNLSTFYLHPGNTVTISFEYILPLIFFISVTGVCCFYVKKCPVLLTAWLIYLITLIPVLGFVQTGAQAMAARYTYLPGLPLSMLFALSITALYVRFYQSQPARVAIITSVLFVLFFNYYHTVRQISFWKDDVALWTRAIELQTGAVGRSYFQRAAGYAAKGDYHNALADMNRAVEIASAKQYKDMHTIYVERARILRQAGDFEAAIADYDRCLVTDTSSMRSMYFQERGMLYKQLGNLDRAKEDFKNAGLE